jgi:hypothetical protein
MYKQKEINRIKFLLTFSDDLSAGRKGDQAPQEQLDIPSGQIGYHNNMGWRSLRQCLSQNSISL